MPLHLTQRLNQIVRTGLLFLVLNTVPAALAQESPPEAAPTLFLALVVGDTAAREIAFNQIEETWQEAFIPMTLESVTLMRDSATTDRLIHLLESETGQNFGFDINRWFEWVWNRESVQHHQYALYKSLLYGLIDQRFSGYFHADRTSKVRLDEVRWGGIEKGLKPMLPVMICETRPAYFLPIMPWSRIMCWRLSIGTWYQFTTSPRRLSMG